MQNATLKKLLARYERLNDRYDRSYFSMGEMMDVIESAYMKCRGNSMNVLFYTAGDSYDIGYVRGYEKAMRKARKMSKGRE